MAMTKRAAKGRINPRTNGLWAHREKRNREFRNSNAYGALRRKTLVWLL